MKAKIVIGCCAVLFFLSWKKRQPAPFTVPPGWPQPAYDFSKNRLTAEKILLGRALFYDPILSADSTVSCSGCHLQYTAFAHVDHALSHGIRYSIGTRNAPALVNLAWSRLFMWDGAVNHLDMQALAPISHPAEMASDINSVIFRLRRSPLYRDLFSRAYGDSNITGERFLKAMSQFMLTIVSAHSKYDLVMRREATFTTQEQNGYRLFKQHCASCHAEPLFTNNSFASNGLPVDSTLKDIGRMKVSGDPSDSLHFKVPTLRNVEFSYPYMHDGRFKRLQDVLDHYVQGIVRSPALSRELEQPVRLSANEKVDLVAFLLTLTDKGFLFDTSLSYPRYLFMARPKEPANTVVK